MDIQTAKIEYMNHWGPTFFVDRAFESGLDQAKAFIKRNAGKRVGFKVYILSGKPHPFPKWSLYSTHPVLTNVNLVRNSNC